MNIGHSSRLIYDNCSYRDRINASTSPLANRLDVNQIWNCNSCLSTLGPRSSIGNGFGVSVPAGVGFGPAMAQKLVDVDSILSNRNVPASRCSDRFVNPINVTKFPLEHAPICNDYLNPLASKLTDPAYNYKGIAIDRFYNLPKNPQANIYWDMAINSKLESRDNYIFKMPKTFKTDQYPVEVRGPPAACVVKCTGGC